MPIRRRSRRCSANTERDVSLGPGRWDPVAVAELGAILDYIAEDDPAAAQAVARRVRRSVDLIDRFPAIGVAGSVETTRVHVVPGLPYFLVYRVRGDIIEILSIFHAARDRPR